MAPPSPAAGGEAAAGPLALAGAYCIVTGANSGIGKEIARGLMAHGAHVVMVCRNMESCETARTELSAGSGPGSCSCAKIDLEDFESVRACASSQRAALRAAGKHLSVLVNNAGVMGVQDTPGGGDRHLRANHFGPFLLTRLLLPAMGPGSRVVTVSSRAHFRGALSFDAASGDVDRHPRWWFPKYARSKLANVAFTREMQVRAKARGVSAYATSPGPVNSPLFRGFPWPVQWVAGAFFRTPEQGAASSVYAATARELDGQDAVFIHDDKPMPASAQAMDPEVGAKLWVASERFVEFGKHPGDKE